jgi:Tfp pilus assembly protein PilN
MTAILETPQVEAEPAGPDEAPKKARRRLEVRKTGKAGPGTAGPADGVGNAPRVDLLPQSIRNQAAQKTLRRRLLAGVAGAAVLVAAGVGGASQYSAAQQQELLAAQAETGTLLGERATFGEFIAIRDRVALAEIAQRVAVSTEVDWSAYLRELQRTLPGGVKLTAASIDSASPVAMFGQATGPLQGPRIATLNFTATSRTLPDVPNWLDSLGSLPAFVDAVPNSVTLDESGVYLVNITMHIGADAYTGRFSADGTESE